MILIVSYADDEHTDLVAEQLRLAGQDVARIDLADFPARLPLRAGWGEGAPTCRIETSDGRAVDLARIRVVWWRRVRPFEIDGAIAGGERRSFAHSETEQAVLGVLDGLDCHWVNPRLADEAAHRKPYQWSVAHALGLTLPETLVTTDPGAARAFVDRLGLGNVVFKAFLASIADWRETRLVRADDLDRLELVRLAPVIFQRYVPGVDLRITAVGGQLFAAEIDARATSYPIDMRMVVGEGIVRPVQLPARVEAQLLALQKRLGLHYGAIDMRRTESGEHVFLEVNPAGQWLFVERRTGQQITRALAQALCAFDNAGQAPPRGRPRNHGERSSQAIGASVES